MGFAVVADEVRSLAGRAAGASRESAETLQRVGDLVVRSRELAGETSAEFGQARREAQKIGALMGEIANACREQSGALEQINHSLSQFEQGTQASAAHAQEAAAASQELRAQALSIRQEIASLDELVHGGVAPAAAPAEEVAPAGETPAAPTRLRAPRGRRADAAVGRTEVVLS